MPKLKNVEAFLAAYPPEVREVVLAARSILDRALPGAAETLDEADRLIGYGYGPGYKGLVCTLILSRSGVKLGLAHGAELPDPKRLLQGSGKVHRYVQLESIADLRRPGLKALLKAALTAWRKRNNSATNARGQ